MAVKVRRQAVVVALVDNALPFGVFGLKGGNGVSELADQLVANLRVDQHVVRGDADLTRVDQLGPGDPLGRDVDVRIRGHDDRALSAELEGYRRQVFCGAFVDLAADFGAAREADVVEALRDELLAAIGTAALILQWQRKNQ